MATIKIGERFELNSDGTQWTLTTYRPGKNKAGEEILTPKNTYHPSLVSALNSALDYAAGEEEGDVQTLLRSIERAKSAIVAAVNGTRPNRPAVRRVSRS